MRTTRMHVLSLQTSRGRTIAAGLIALLAVWVVGASLAWGAPAPEATTDGMGVSAARVRDILDRHPLHTLDGAAVSLTSLRGDVVVINFWASWCSPCRKELPRLDALHADMARRGGRVLAISIDNERSNVERFAKQHGLKLPVIHDGPNGLARDLDLRYIPFTIVLDRNGDVAYTTSRSDEAGLIALAATTHQLMADKPVATRTAEGDKP